MLLLLAITQKGGGQNKVENEVKWQKLADWIIETQHKKHPLTALFRNNYQIGIEF